MHRTSIMLWIALAAAPGCGSTTEPRADGSTTPDAGSDLTTHDQTTPDTGQPDTGQPDASNPDTTTPDAASPDTLAPDLAAPCSYVQGGASDTRVVKCGSAYKVILSYSSKLGPPQCPSYWTVGGVKSAVSAVDAANKAGCDSSCLWFFSKAVLGLYCGKKLGFEVLVAPGCKDLYKYPDGYYDSTAAYAAAHPCP